MAPKIQASVVILTKNEERHIARAVDSARRFSEVLVVDSGSIDDTSAIAVDGGARVIQFAWDHQYPKKKEWALAHVTHDWVIYLDADEFLSPELVSEIEHAISDPTMSSFEVPLRYYWLGRELKYGHRVSKRIGIRRSTCRWPRPDDLDVKNMWEVEGHYQPTVLSGESTMLESRMGHDDQDGLYDYFARHNRYSDWEAMMLFKRDQESVQSRSRLGRLAVRLPLKPQIFLVYSFVLRGGFLDGTAGWQYARALSYYYWQIGLKRQELRQVYAATTASDVSLKQPALMTVDTAESA